MDTPKINFVLLQKDSWSQEEQENVKLVIEFVQRLMNEHDFDYVIKNYGQSTYTQHNRSMTDGVIGVVDYVKNLTKQFPEFSYEVKNIYSDGEFVTVHSHATVRANDRGNEKKGFIIFDTWKVENGKLVEHWDALQPLDFGMRLFSLFAGGTIRNKNGLF